jgi:hypothetical protein
VIYFRKRVNLFLLNLELDMEKVVACNLYEVMGFLIFTALGFAFFKTFQKTLGINVTKRRKS